MELLAGTFLAVKEHEHVAYVQPGVRLKERTRLDNPTAARYEVVDKEYRFPLLVASLDPEAVAVALLGGVDVHHGDAAAKRERCRQVEPAEWYAADALEELHAFVEHRLAGLHFLVHDAGGAGKCPWIAD